MPVCQRCQAQIPQDEARELRGQVLCEDCYMDALSPARTCDPWATYTASRLGSQELSPVQEKILAEIDRRGAATAEELMAAAGIDARELERQIAALRHMELVRAAPALGGGKVFRRFHDRPEAAA